MYLSIYRSVDNREITFSLRNQAQILGDCRCVCVCVCVCKSTLAGDCEDWIADVSGVQ